ncbi:MAG TPA: HAD family hydrolase, partial [Spirochaetia bacterium]|nr:HAD family hydrolase [Spirochaetia bacterium]
RGLHNLVYDALPETKKDLAETVYKEAHAIFAQRGVGTATLYPGVMETLDTLKLAGIALAVVSNKPHEAVGAIIDELGIREYFVGVYGGQRHIPLKPHPESIQPAIETVQKLIPHCNLSEIALLGDSNVDMETAHNAHIVPLGAGWGFRGVQELTEAGASVILMSIKELIPLLGLI